MYGNTAFDHGHCSISSACIVKDGLHMEQGNYGENFDRGYEEQARPRQQVIVIGEPVPACNLFAGTWNSCDCIQLFALYWNYSCTDRIATGNCKSCAEAAGQRTCDCRDYYRNIRNIIVDIVYFGVCCCGTCFIIPG